MKTFLTILPLTLLAAGFPLRAETVHGTLRYMDSNGMVHPIANATVEIWRWRWRWGMFSGYDWFKDGYALTNENGYFLTALPFEGGGVVCSVRVLANNQAAVVYNENYGGTFYAEPGHPASGFRLKVNCPSDVLDFSWDFWDPAVTRHYHAAESIRQAYLYVTQNRDPMETDPLPQVNVIFRDSTSDPFDGIILPKGSGLQTVTVLAAYAKFMLAKISGTGSKANTDARKACAGQAFAEGFTRFFPRAVLRKFPEWAFETPSQIETANRELENAYVAGEVIGQYGNCGLITPDLIPGLIAAALWDLADASCGQSSRCDRGSAIEDFDNASDLDGLILKVIDRDMPSGYDFPTLTRFYTGFDKRRFGALDSIFSHYGLPVPLRLFYSDWRGDNFSTATSKGMQDAINAGYRFVRIEGYVFPNYQNGAVPLKLYWGRSDNFTTATPAGEQDALAVGYTLARVEAYLYPNPQLGTVPLNLYYSVARGDNFTLATTTAETDAQNASYRFVRNEGYLLPVN
ncbi:MAG: hypothetical protein HY820_43750 [Acidobacteria bacterium]|nr:hypothetical protein [Acidobacteriota bacterium]